LREAARERLRLWDISSAEVRELERSGVVRKSLTIHSPVGGYVLNKVAVEGARVMPGELLFEIADLDRVWVQADIYKSEIQACRVGAPAAMPLSHSPGRTGTGRVTFVAPVIDPMTRTVKIRL